MPLHNSVKSHFDLNNAGVVRNLDRSDPPSLSAMAGQAGLLIVATGFTPMPLHN